MKWIVFFDGDCGLCSRSVRFFAKFDRRDHLRFAPLQGETAAAKEFGKYAAIDDGTMVVLREADGEIFYRFDALLESLRALGGLWKVLLVAKFLPRSIREILYRTVARNRIRWFGKADACALPDPELVRRLLP
jgi:predicted DCC family thiol-disulfide oxidoreductase YuxK